MNDYVHGYSDDEAYRLLDQANTLAELLHHDTVYPEGSKVLEAGCGIGAQTVILAKNNPGALFTSIDISPDSLETARQSVAAEGLSNVAFQVADIFNLPFEAQSFDHIFVCFVLEHLSQPGKALSQLKRFLRPGGSVTVIEGDHGSYYSCPYSLEASMAVQCLIDVQTRMGGNALIGRELYPLLIRAGFSEVRVSPRMVYVDASRPHLVEGFSKKTFIAMIEGVKDQALGLGLVKHATWEKGISDLYRATEKDGTFCYTFFKGTGIRG